MPVCPLPRGAGRPELLFHRDGLNAFQSPPWPGSLENSREHPADVLVSDSTSTHLGKKKGKLTILFQTNVSPQSRSALFWTCKAVGGRPFEAFV